MRGTLAWTRYLIQRVAGSCTSWELHRLEERLWGSRAAILRHPHRSGGLSHTSPSICGEKKGRSDIRHMFLWLQRPRHLCRAGRSQHRWAEQCGAHQLWIVMPSLCTAHVCSHTHTDTHTLPAVAPMLHQDTPPPRSQPLESSRMKPRSQRRDLAA